MALAKKSDDKLDIEEVKNVWQFLLYILTNKKILIPAIIIAIIIVIFISTRVIITPKETKIDYDPTRIPKIIKGITNSNDINKPIKKR